MHTYLHKAHTSSDNNYNLLPIIQKQMFMSQPADKSPLRHQQNLFQAPA